MAAEGIKTLQEFEERLATLGRMYRSLLSIWIVTSASDEKEIAKWVETGSAMIERVDELLSEIEEYAGCMELRPIIDRLKQIRIERLAAAGKETEKA